MALWAEEPFLHVKFHDVQRKSDVDFTQVPRIASHINRRLRVAFLPVRDESDRVLNMRASRTASLRRGLTC